MNTNDREVEKAFWSRVDKSGGENSCWPWTGSVNRAVNVGYGLFLFRGWRVYAHRAAYQLAHETDVPTTTLVRHKCGDKLCCNPKHLKLGTHHDNHKDAVRAGTKKGLLTEAKIIKAFRLAKGGMNLHQIGKRVGVMGSTLKEVFEGRLHVKLVKRLRNKGKV